MTPRLSKTRILKARRRPPTYSHCIAMGNVQKKKKKNRRERKRKA